MMYRVIVMVSGAGTNLQALIDSSRSGALKAEIAAVVSDQPEAPGLARAQAAQLPTVCVPLLPTVDREEWATLISDMIAPFKPNLLVMAGWMQIMPASFVERWSPNLINQHPALLPEDNGPTYTTGSGLVIPAIRGRHAVRDTLAQGLLISGCTIHQVTAEVDVGPVLARAEVPVEPGDTSATLHERIKSHEHRLIVQVINQLAAGASAAPPA